METAYLLSVYTFPIWLSVLLTVIAVLKAREVAFWWAAAGFFWAGAGAISYLVTYSFHIVNASCNRLNLLATVVATAAAVVSAVVFLKQGGSVEKLFSRLLAARARFAA